MYERLLDVDPMTGAVETFYYDPETGRCTIDRQCDVTAILEANQALYTQYDERSRWGNEPMHHVASVPLEVMEQFKQDTGINPYAPLDPSERHRFHQWLDDSANRMFRTRPGKLSR